ncbi:fimbria/pilus outer membrane usher protein [Leminorella grimontii]|uniref:fimbria/pilus outer membrane usher protein n=1 Tax=Leminorella grimontii TaxID=82981 RepID=UPI00321FC659
MINKSRHPKRKKHYIFLFLPLFFLGSSSIYAAESTDITFNASFLKGVSLSQEDLSSLLKDDGGPAVSGSYFVEIYVNGSFFTNDSVEFQPNEKGEVRPCIPLPLLLQAGVFKSKIAPEQASRECLFLEQGLEGATTSFNQENLRLELSIPQASLAGTVRGYVSPDDWNEGNSALFVSYSGNYFNSQNRQGGPRNESVYFYLRDGVNLGAWQIRNSSNVRYTPDDGAKFNSAGTYLQRALPGIQSQLIAGETSTTNTIFSPFSFKGATLKSDERMLSPNQQGYAPEVRGMANTNARVSIKQSGRIIYETTVAPGPFVINDLYPTLNSGDLTVEVTESDGQIYSFIVPFSSVTNSLRPGLSKYSVTLGKTDSAYVNAENTNFAEVTYERGINNALTVNGGLQAADNHYYSAATGAVVATSWGAFGVGGSFSQAKTADGSRQGWQLDTQYSKTFSATETTVSMAGYRYSSDGYRTLSDSLSYGSTPYYVDDDRVTTRSTSYQQRQRLEVSLSQNLSGYGSVFANALWQDYYDSRSSNRQYQVGYQNSLGKVSYSITAARQMSTADSGRKEYDDVVTLSFRVPLGTRTSLSSHVSHYGKGGTNATAGVSGTLGEGNDYSYGVNVAYDANNSANSISGNLNHQNSFGNWGVGYSHSDASRTYSATAQGAVVVHGGGVTLGPYLGDTFGIIEVPNGKGVQVTNVSGLELNGSGYAIIPSLVPYRYNHITLDPKGIGNSVELEETQKRVAPYAGAIPMMTFKTRTGYPVLIESLTDDGRPLPIGLDVYDESDASIGIIGPGSRVYGRVARLAGELYVKPYGKSEKCTIRYEIDEKEKDEILIQLLSPCVAVR